MATLGRQFRSDKVSKAAWLRQPRIAGRLPVQYAKRDVDSGVESGKGRRLAVVPVVGSQEETIAETGCTATLGLRASLNVLGRSASSLLEQLSIKRGAINVEPLNDCGLGSLDRICLSILNEPFYPQPARAARVIDGPGQQAFGAAVGCTPTQQTDFAVRASL